MKLMLSWWRALALGTLAVTGLVLAGCTEKLEGTGACPTACTDAAANIQTVDLQAAIVTDTTVLGGLGLGTESRMLLASRGDTLDTRVIIRFDTLPSTAVPKSGASAAPITTVDSAYLRLRLDSAAARVNAPVTVNVYDVDAPGSDTSVAALAPLFVSSRLITSYAVAANKLVDSLAIPLPNALVLAKAQAGARLRVGLQLSAPVSVQTRVYATGTAVPPRLTLRTSPDTSVARVTLAPYSATPVGNTSIAASLADFTLVVKGVSSPAPGLLAVGGLPARRAYFKFSIPPRIVDSSVVVRASLLLTQVPSGSPGPSDTMFVLPATVVAGPTVTDPGKAAQIVSATVTHYDSLFTTPAAQGQKLIEIAPVFATWAVQSDTLLPRAIVLRSTTEEYSAQQVLFYSSEAANPAVRPVLRVSYTRRARIGLP